ncbi:MAG: hypothetical protein WDN69_31660 [Aliidongia sp.]
MTTDDRTNADADLFDLRDGDRRDPVPAGQQSDRRRIHGEWRTGRADQRGGEYAVGNRLARVPVKIIRREMMGKTGSYCRLHRTSARLRRQDFENSNMPVPTMKRWASFLSAVLAGIIASTGALAAYPLECGLKIPADLQPVLAKHEPGFRLRDWRISTQRASTMP